MPVAAASREEFNLFNPAFTALCLSEAARGHVEESGEPGSLPILFSATIAALFSHLRADLPSSTRTHVSKWIVDHPEFRPEFQRLAKATAPAVKDGLRFAVSHNLLRSDAALLVPQGRRRSRPADFTDETSEILAKARFLGRWFAKAGSPATVLSLLGFGR